MIKQIYMALLIPVFLVGCHYYNHDLSFKNKSALRLAISYTNNRNNSNGNNIAYYLSDRTIIEPDSMWYMVKPGRADAWLDYIQETDEKKLFIYVWNVDTLKKYSNSYTLFDLQNARKYIKSFVLTEHQLKKHQWLTEIK